MLWANNAMAEVADVVRLSENDEIYYTKHYNNLTTIHR